jgi:hypothetical protein
LAGKERSSFGSWLVSGTPSGNDDTNPAEIVGERCPSSAPLALVLAAIEELQEAGSKGMSQFEGKTAQVKL